MSKPLQIKSVLGSCFIIQQSLLFPNRMAGHLNEMQLHRIFAKTADATMWAVVLFISCAWIYTTCTGYQGNVVTVTNIDLSFFLSVDSSGIVYATQVYLHTVISISPQVNSKRS